MKALKITLLLAVVVLLTVSVVKSDVVIQDETPTYKEYSPKELLALKRGKAKLEAAG